jgi:TolB-like protein
MAHETEDLGDHPSGPSPESRLDSWKEIAAYLKCSERTVRRWEQEGLPVHRHPHKKKAGIYAYKAEIDAWWHNGHEHLKSLEEPPEETLKQSVEEPAVSTRWWRPLGALALGFAVLAIAVGVLIAGRLRERILSRAPSGRIESVAVLPLENLSHDPDQEYFVDGMTDALITDLAKIHSLRIISRTSVMEYKGKRKPMREIARELNVNAVVEGTVMRSGDRVRITAQLVEAPNDRHLWADTYERDLRDVLALQDEVALAYAELGQSEQALAAAARAEKSTQNPVILSHVAAAYAIAGRKDKARTMIRGIEAQARERYVCGFNVACLYSVLGDKEQAFAWLDKAYRDRSD